MLLIMYQIFSSLLGHLPFLVHFLLHFYGVTFFGTPNTLKNLLFAAKVIIVVHTVYEWDKFKHQGQFWNQWKKWRKTDPVKYPRNYH